MRFKQIIPICRSNAINRGHIITVFCNNEPYSAKEIEDFVCFGII
jgi:hypothetical protein